MLSEVVKMVIVFFFSVNIFIWLEVNY